VNHKEKGWSRKECNAKICEYCAGEEVLYQTSTYADLYIDTFGHSKILVAAPHKCCPAYVYCCAKDVSFRAGFIINFCSECGRELCQEKGG